ncbi:MAG: 23S rRNA (pseudouridine(1915)-N(3))-methyltransferase RlmH [Ruminococcaceae bacterium]|nr:23S rRNA (pseudouridine(1915)-N(3))-methyltransferase RlmH [Oscillospiraceae bacterium]
MEITIITVGKLKEAFFRDAVSEYIKRLSRFAKCNIIELPDEKIPDNPSEKQKQQILEKEGNAILAQLKERSFFVTLCVEGKTLSSEEFAQKIADSAMQTDRICFAIGGSLGLSDAVKNASQLRLSFGRMTLPHQLMRVVLCEQIYRAFKINANETYHK